MAFMTGWAVRAAAVLGVAVPALALANPPLAPLPPSSGVPAARVGTGAMLPAGVIQPPSSLFPSFAPLQAPVFPYAAVPVSRANALMLRDLSALRAQEAKLRTDLDASFAQLQHGTLSKLLRGAAYDPSIDGWSMPASAPASVPLIDYAVRGGALVVRTGPRMAMSRDRLLRLPYEAIPPGDTPDERAASAAMIESVTGKIKAEMQAYADARAALAENLKWQLRTMEAIMPPSSLPKKK